MFEELKRKLTLIDSISRLQFNLSADNSKCLSLLLNMTWNDFFYIYDNGSPRYSIKPKNLSRWFHHEFQDKWSHEISSEVADGILNKSWDEGQVNECIESFRRKIRKQIQNRVANDIINLNNGNITEKINAKEFSEHITLDVRING